jgi:hypothetical protein
MKWSRRHSLIAGLALIALTNAVALGGAAYNRSGEPESVLRLTQRELQPPYFFGRRENSGLALRLRWRVLQEGASDVDSYSWGGTGEGASPPWLDREKMASLGFDVALADTELDKPRSFRRQLPRDVLLVLEFDGPAYQRSLVNAAEFAARLEKKNLAESSKLAVQVVERERNANSRIFVVDAGLDRAALRTKYGDRSKYAIVGGQVRPAWRSARVPKSHAGYVDALNVGAVNVPLEFRDAFEGASPDIEFVQTSTSKVRYEATVAFGKRLEPWITAAARK